jgi:hypothetical protein
MSDASMLRVVATGRDAGLDWELHAGPERLGDAVRLTMKVPAFGSESGGSSAVRGPRSLSYGVGIGSTGPRELTVCAGAEVASVEVRYQGRREPVMLHADPAGEFSARVGVRLFPRGVRITELVAYDAGGQVLAREVPEHSVSNLSLVGRLRDRAAGWISSVRYRR